MIGEVTNAKNPAETRLSLSNRTPTSTVPRLPQPAHSLGLGVLPALSEEHAETRITQSSTVVLTVFNHANPLWYTEI